MLQLNLLNLPQEPLSLWEGALKSSLPQERPACPKPNKQPVRRKTVNFTAEKESRDLKIYSHFHQYLLHGLGGF